MGCSKRHSARSARLVGLCIAATAALAFSVAVFTGVAFASPTSCVLGCTWQGTTFVDATFSPPIVLGASQAWSIRGGSGAGNVDIFGGISGASDTLTVNFPSSSANLNLVSDVEVGSFASQGTGGSGIVGLNPGSSLDGTNGNPGAFSNSTLGDFASA